MASDDRYRQRPILVVNGVRHRALRPVPKPVYDPRAIEHVLVQGESLESLAAAYYGRSELWWRIADANPQRRCAFDFVPGDVILIPPPESAFKVARRRDG